MLRQLPVLAHAPEASDDAVSCTTTLYQDQSLTITYEVTAVQYERGSGTQVCTADYPHCNDPTSYPRPYPTAYPEGCT